MHIPIFVSRPTSLNPQQRTFAEYVCGVLEDLGLDTRTLGRTDYPTYNPLREVFSIAKHCSGALILGFIQCECTAGVSKPGTEQQKALRDPVVFPTPWNQLEAGIAYSLRLPILVFREHGINGGIFDPGVSDIFVHEMPRIPITEEKKEEVREVCLKWQAAVRGHYYRYTR